MCRCRRWCCRSDLQPRISCHTLVQAQTITGHQSISPARSSLQLHSLGRLMGQHVCRTADMIKTQALLHCLPGVAGSAAHSRLRSRDHRRCRWGRRRPSMTGSTSGCSIRGSRWGLCKWYSSVDAVGGMALLTARNACDIDAGGCSNVLPVAVSDQATGRWPR